MINKRLERVFRTAEGCAQYKELILLLAMAGKNYLKTKREISRRLKKNLKLSDEKAHREAARIIQAAIDTLNPKKKNVKGS